ncbi:uncharacterized protein LOC113500691 isoform X2 [Trichoplusia ni]|uniref:Galectin n=1 Tax=Trichoplusia ni TaxID=7111 RepID=A0A7E5W9P5_TRINI|nr:uncharacterized protein LOC113500691 isoform X2 [Trichoplusia ni]
MSLCGANSEYLFTIDRRTHERDENSRTQLLFVNVKYFKRHKIWTQTNVKTNWLTKTDREGTRSEEPYSVQLNGNVSRAPPWPRPRSSNEKMFLIPKQLDVEDKIIISCRLRDDPSEFKIGLATGYDQPDYNNLACQFEMLLKEQDKYTVRIISNGQYNDQFGGPASEVYGDTFFRMEFQIRNRNQMDIFVEESHITSINLMHSLESIRFLTVNGDIDRVVSLNFEFGPSS